MCVHAVRLSLFGMLIVLLNYSTVFSGVTRGLSQGETKLKGPTSEHSKN